MNKYKVKSRISNVITASFSIFVIGSFLLVIAELKMHPDIPLKFIIMRDIGLALLVATIPYIVFKLLDHYIERPDDIIKYLGSKYEARSDLDDIILHAKKRIDILGLSLCNLFSGSIDEHIIFSKVLAGCYIRIFTLSSESEVTRLRAIDEGYSKEDTLKRYYKPAEEKWRKLFDLFINHKEKYTNVGDINGILKIYSYSSLPYFSLSANEKNMIFGLYNRHIECKTSSAFDISESSILKEKFYSDLSFLEGCHLIEKTIIDFQGGILSSDIFEVPDNFCETR